MTYRFDIITLFPDFFETLPRVGLIGKAVERGLLTFRVHDLRPFGLGRYRQVDDRAYGGGVGIVLRPEPVVAAIEKARQSERSRVLVMSPQGRLWTQRRARQLVAEADQVILVCGRYEGIDERVARFFADDEIAIGDYVLMGGEVAAWVIIESIARLIPGVIGNPESLELESFERGILDHPQYTRPENFRGYRVPAILRSGHHQAVDQWRRLQALKKTVEHRPDLLLQSLYETASTTPVWLSWLKDWILWLEKQYNKLYPAQKNRSEADHAGSDSETPTTEDANGSSGHSPR